MIFLCLSDSIQKFSSKVFCSSCSDCLSQPEVCWLIPFAHSSFTMEAILVTYLWLWKILDEFRMFQTRSPVLLPRSVKCPASCSHFQSKHFQSRSLYSTHSYRSSFWFPSYRRWCNTGRMSRLWPWVRSWGRNTFCWSARTKCRTKAILSGSWCPFCTPWLKNRPKRSHSTVWRGRGRFRVHRRKSEGWGSGLCPGCVCRGGKNGGFSFLCRFRFFWRVLQSDRQGLNAECHWQKGTFKEFYSQQKRFDLSMSLE